MSAGALSRRPAIFSSDGRLVLTPSGNAVRIYSAATGEQVGLLKGHTDDVTCATLNPQAASQVYTASKDRALKLWDYETQECLKTFNVREIVRSMLFSADLPVAYLSIEWRDGASGRVITYDLDKSRAGSTAMKTRTPGPLIAGSPTPGSSHGATFVATFDRHSLFVWRSGREICQPLNLHHTKPFTCAAISPDETVIAAGDASGRILIWHEFGAHVPQERREGQHSGKHQPEKPPPVSTLHWHASAVSSLAFSSDGTFLLSGGREGVLVVWQLESGKQSYLPRLGGALIGIHPSPVDPAAYLLRQADNTLRLVNTATMKVEVSVLGLRPRPAGLSALEASRSTLLQPGSGHLIVPVENAQLQVFDTVHERHISLIQVTPRNVVVGSDAADAWGPYGPPAEPAVQHTAMSREGLCMATVDVRPDAGPFNSAESCLKFWDKADAVSGSGTRVPFTLNTRIDDPHRGAITSLSYHPSAHLAVTTGADAEFRVWERVNSQRRPGGKAEAPSCWRCRCRGSYKSLPLSASAFSHDGSTLAVAAGSRVTLWEPLSCTLAATLPVPADLAASGGLLQHLSFVSGSAHLVGASEHYLVVWNLLTGSLAWSLDLHACALAADPVHARFAVAVPAPAAAATASGHATAAAAETGTAAAAETQGAAAGSSQGGQHNAPAPGSLPSSSPSCHVLVFDPASPTPKYHTCVRGCAAASLLYVPPGLPQHAEASRGLPQDSSPLLVVTDSRSYAYTAMPGQSGPDASPSSLPADNTRAAGAQDTGGMSHLLTADPSYQLQAGQAMDVDVDPTQPRWRQLFDAPSHALPPATMLAQAFLRLITTDT